MSFQAQAQTKLRDLAEKRSLPRSQCGREFLKLLAPLLDSGVVGWQRAGTGRRLVVNDADTLRDFSRHWFPNANLPNYAGSRLASVGHFRNTKAIPNSENEIISLRVWRNDALLKNGRPLDAVALTDAHGLFSFLFTRNCPYALCGLCALTENPALFAAVERLNLGLDAVIYGGGRISSRVLDWLVGTTHAEFSLLHLPDYDPSGLSEFQRLERHLGTRVSLYVPSDIEMRFARFSNPKLLTKANTQALLSQLRLSRITPIRYVTELIDRYNAGLEQEALLIPV
jgi:hypothetical protein